MEQQALRKAAVACEMDHGRSGKQQRVVRRKRRTRRKQYRRIRKESRGMRKIDDAVQRNDGRDARRQEREAKLVHHYGRNHELFQHQKTRLKP